MNIYRSYRVLVIAGLFLSSFAMSCAQESAFTIEQCNSEEQVDNAWKLYQENRVIMNMDCGVYREQVRVNNTVCGKLGGQVVSYATYNITHNGTGGHVYLLAVHSNFRGRRGMGKATLMELEKHMLQHHPGITKFWLYVGQGNALARALYNRLGYGPAEGVTEASSIQRYEKKLLVAQQVVVPIVNAMPTVTIKPIVTVEPKKQSVWASYATKKCALGVVATLVAGGILFWKYRSWCAAKA